MPESAVKKPSIKSLMKDLIQISRKYGSDPSHIIAGGGNTSIKRGGRLWIKASGQALATIDESGFLEMRMAEVLGILNRKDWSDDRDEREDQIVKVLLDARVNPPHPNMRPSVESTLHALMPQTFVLHTHGAGQWGHLLEAGRKGLCLTPAAQEGARGLDPLCRSRHALGANPR